MKTLLLSLLFLVPAVGCLQINKAGPLWPKGSGATGPTRWPTYLTDLKRSP